MRALQPETTIMRMAAAAARELVLSGDEVLNIDGAIHAALRVALLNPTERIFEGAQPIRRRALWAKTIATILTEHEKRFPRVEGQREFLTRYHQRLNHLAESRALKVRG